VVINHFVVAFLIKISMLLVRRFSKSVLYVCRLVISDFSRLTPILVEMTILSKLTQNPNWETCYQDDDGEAKIDLGQNESYLGTSPQVVMYLPSHTSF
jgi:hypothetical protein